MNQDSISKTSCNASWSWNAPLQASLETYKEVFGLRRICERASTIIAEALSRIEAISPDLHTRVDNVRKIANFRNVIVHDYFYVDDAYVWKVIHYSVPILKQQITDWAAELDKI